MNNLGPKKLRIQKFGFLKHIDKVYIADSLYMCWCNKRAKEQTSIVVDTSDLPIQDVMSDSDSTVSDRIFLKQAKPSFILLIFS